MPEQRGDIRRVLEEHRAELMQIPGVVGTGIGGSADQPVVKVYAVEATPELRSRLPGTLEGWPVELQVTGPFRTLG